MTSRALTRAIGSVDLSGYATTTALANGLAPKAPLASPAFTGTPTGITKAHVGLGSVDNTADSAKPVSTAQAAAIALKLNASTPLREVLTANRTYYVRTDGSNSNNGLANTAGGAFLTISAALNAIGSRIDFNGFTVTVSVGAGTFAENVKIPSMVGQLSASSLIISGAGNTTLIRGSNGYQGAILASGAGAAATLTAMRVENSNTDGVGIMAQDSGKIIIGTGIEFGSVGTSGASGDCVMASRCGVVSCASQTITVTANVYRFVRAMDAGIVSFQNCTIACGTRTFSITVTAWALGYIEWNSNTFTGTITGARYAATTNAVIQTYGGGASAIAGSTSGSVSTGGVYN